jgi:hypothetical protein
MAQNAREIALGMCACPGLAEIPDFCFGTSISYRNSLCQSKYFWEIFSDLSFERSAMKFVGYRTTGPATSKPANSGEMAYITYTLMPDFEVVFSKLLFAMRALPKRSSSGLCVDHEAVTIPVNP